MNVVIVTRGGHTLYYGPMIPNDAQQFAASLLQFGNTVSIQTLIPMEVK